MHSEETKFKIRIAHLGVKKGRPSPECIEKIRKSLTGRKLSEEHKARLRGPRPHTRGPKLHIRGPKHYRWSGGCSKIGRKSPGVCKWRKMVLSRDNYECQKCFSRKKLNAHHIFSYMDIHPAQYAPLEYRSNINNGVALCSNCHKEFHRQYGWGGNTYDQLVEFLEDRLAAGAATVLDRDPQFIADNLDHWDHKTALDISTDQTRGEFILSNVRVGGDSLLQ